MVLPRRFRHLELVPDAAGVPSDAAVPAVLPAAAEPPIQPEVADDILPPVDVVVLTADEALLHAATDAIGERNRARHATSAEAAADLLVAGRCGVLLIDTASVSARADTLIGQIVEQFPDVVVCVAGTRDDEPLLARLISDGLVARFMHKPASARRAGMFLQAAIRLHRERRGGNAAWPPLLDTLARPGKGLPAKFLAALGVLSVLLTVPVFIGGEPEAPVAKPVAGEPVAVSRQASAMPANATGERAATAPQADPVLSRARAALHAGRLAAPEGRNALDLFRAVLLAQPGHAEASAGLARTMDRLLEVAATAATSGDKAEAERLVERVLEVDPRHGAALELAAKLNPPETPSQQLAIEQAAAAAGATDSTAVADATGDALLPPMPPMPPMPPVPGPVAESASPVSTAVMTPGRRPRSSGVVQPDPLSPRFVNGVDSDRVDTLSRPRHYGGSVARRLPIAGTAALPAAEPVPETAVPDQSGGTAVAAPPDQSTDAPVAPSPEVQRP